jgi:hypothetical protein
MKWKEIDHTFHGLTAEVKDPRRPKSKADTVMGVINCEAEGVITILRSGAEKVHMFAWWFEVEIID